MRHVSADDACMDVVLEQKGAGLLIDLNNHEDTLQQVMKQAYVAVGTDGGAVDLSIRGPMVPLVHPRQVGIFPRWLGHYVREEKLMGLEEAGRRMTTLAASILHEISRDSQCRYLRRYHGVRFAGDHRSRHIRRSESLFRRCALSVRQRKNCGPRGTAHPGIAQPCAATPRL